jgi:serine/threonine-protein kinase
MNPVRKVFFALAIASLPMIAGCSSSTTPPPPPAPQRVYVTDDATPTIMSIFTTPLTNSSVASASFSTAASAVSGMKFDTAGNLYIAAFSAGAVQIYHQPVGTGSTAAVTIPALNAAEDVALDTAGNLYVGTSVGVAVITPPFSNASTPSFTMTNATFGYGLAFDSGGNLWVGNNGTGFIQKFTPPFSAGEAEAFHFAGGHRGIAFDGAGNLYSSDATGHVEVFTPPFSGASTAAFTITLPAGTASYLAFDRNGNLYVGNAGTSLYVYTPPFSGASLPAVTVTVPVFSWGVGVGP